MAELPARRRLRERRQQAQRQQEQHATAVVATVTEGEDAYVDTFSETTAAERNQEAWKQFGAGTEAGRLLKKLYGDNSRPRIRYPKVKTQPRGPVPAFVPAGGKHDVDARKPKQEPTGRVHVPRPTGGHEVRAPAP